MSFAPPYQPYGSQTPASQPAKKSLSSTVNFSDQSYEMPYFVDVDAPAMKASDVARKPVASRPLTSIPRSMAPKHGLEDHKSKTLQENTTPTISKGAEHAPRLPPRTPSFDPNPAAFLQSFEFPSIQNFHIEPKSQSPDSSQWLSQDPLFINWKTSKHEWLWLRGSEGCGKSTLMEHTLHTQLQNDPSAIHLTYSFSICGSELARTRLGLFRALLHQLIPQSPETFIDVKARFEKIRSVLPPKQRVAWGAQELFEDLTKAIAKILKARSVCIYVDSIDRSEGETAAKLVQDFSKLLEKSQPKPSAKEPTITNGLKILFSSTIFPAKEPFPQSYIYVDERNGPSVRQFLEEQLSNTDTNTRQLVLSKSGSSFVSARLIIHHIKLFGPMQSSLVQQPSPTPAPVSFLLGEYFQNMAQQGNKSLTSLLSWSCLASRPLTLAELRVALSLDIIPKLESTKDLSQAEPFSRYGSDESFQSWIKATSWGLLETVNLRGQKVVKVMHDSISSFFISKGLDILSYNSRPPESQSSPLQIAHNSLATSLLRYLALLHKEPQWEQRIHREPTLRLLQYAGANWSHHISAAGLSKPEASKILKLIQWPSDSVLNVLVKLDQDHHAIGELQGTLWAHIFAVYGHAPLLSVAIKKAGSDVLGLQDNQKRSPLHHAALHGHLAASKQLLKSGTKADARAINGQTALHFAVIQGHQSVLKHLMDSDPSLVSATNDLAQTPLLLAAIRGSSSVIKLLLERRSDVKALDRFKSSVLHYAVGTDKPSVFKLLLDSGADMNFQNAQGRTPLHLAIAEDRPVIIKLLLERGCQLGIPDISGRTALHEAAASGNKSCAQELLKQRVAVDVKDSDGQTALVFAVQGLHAGVVKLLLESRADANARDKLGFNVLMLAVRANHEKITKLLLDADPDLDALSREGHTVIFYAVYRRKAVSLLSEKEQSVASLLLKRYKKKHVTWNAEWIACKDKFMAEHGKKGEGDVKPKSKAGSKKTVVSPSKSLPGKENAQKPVKSEDVVKPSTAPKVSPPKPSALVAGPHESAKPGPKADPKIDPKAGPKPYPKPEVVSKTTQSHPKANAYAPFNSSSRGPMTSPPLPQRPTATPNTSGFVPTETHQKQQTSTFTSYQPSQPIVGNGVQTGFNPAAGSSRAPQASQAGNATVQQRVPISHRSSWDMYSALSATSPDSAQTTPENAQKSYTSYSGTSQTTSAGGSFKPFQPFQPNPSHGNLSTASPQPKSQPDDRYFLPSQNSYSQAGFNASGKPVTQQGMVQSYQPFSSNPQKPSSPPYQPQAPYQERIDSTIKPIAPLSVGRKPVGGHQPAQPMAGKSGKSSPPNHLQPSQPPPGIYQATQGKSKSQSGTLSSLPAAANVSPQAAQGKQLAAPFTSQKPTGTQQSTANPRPSIAQQPTSAHKPTKGQTTSSQRPSPSQKAPIPQPSTAAQRSVAAQVNQKHSPGQHPASAPRTPLGQPTPAQKPSLPQQPGSISKPPPVQQQSASAQKPAPAQQSGPANKPSPIQKPAPQQTAPSEKRPVPSGPVVTPGKATSVQKPDSSVHKKPTPSLAYPSGPSSRIQSASGQRSNETYSSSSTHTQSHDTKHSGFGNSSGGKVAAAAGAGALASAAGGYFLSNHIQEHHYESISINNQNFSSDNGYYQPVPPVSCTENYYLAPVEPSEHSEEYSEVEESEDDHKSDDESEDDDSISVSVESSEAGDSGDQALSEDNSDGGDSDEDGSVDEDDVGSLDFDHDELDSPDVTANFTDDEDTDDNGDFDNDDGDVSSDEDMNVRDMQAESDSDLDTGLGQDDSDSQSDGNIGQEVESDEESDNKTEHLQGHYQQQTVDQSDSEDEEQQVQYDDYQQHVIGESDSEDEVEQVNYNDQYQQQGYSQQQYQQEAFQQPESDGEEQPGYYANHQQHAVDQSDSEDETEAQQNYQHDQYQQQGNYHGQYQHQVQQPDTDDESDNQLNGQDDYSEEEDNNYGGQNYGGGGYYDGAGYDSDY